MWQVHMLPVDQIGPNPMQPREIFDEADLAELTATVAERGVQSPISVQNQRRGNSGPQEGERKM